MIQLDENGDVVRSLELLSDHLLNLWVSRLVPSFDISSSLHINFPLTALESRS